MLFDTLENRRMFAALVGTQLQAIGGAAADVIRISQQDAATIRVETNGIVQFFADANVNSIFMNGNGGNDTLQVISTAALPLTEPARIFGGDGNDALTGGNGADLLSGGAGNDGLSGGIGNDNLDGGTGNNNLSGGDGNDAMTAGTGRDNFNGGAGVDTVSYSSRTASLNITLDGVANDGQLVAIFPFAFENDNVFETVENVTGGSGNDVITAGPAILANTFLGGGGNDRLNGRSGNDRLDGGAGDDILIGGNENDLLIGAAGNDQLLGGTGADNLQGGDGNDVLNGGLGNDQLRGQNGNDILLAADGAFDAVIDGGAGFDIADRDAGDAAAIATELLV